VAVHQSYIEAGSNILTTATYQATYQRLLEYGYTEEIVDALFYKSVQLARTAIAQNPQFSPIWVAASIGPYGAYLADGSEYTGKYGLSVNELMDFHRKRLERIEEAEPDLIAFETIPCLSAIEAICHLLSDKKSLQAWVSLSCQSGDALVSGESLKEVVALIEACPQIEAIGANCIAPAIVTSIIKTIREATDLPIIVYPNSGERWDAQNRCWVNDPSSTQLSDFIEEWASAGANIFGGCCRTRPTDIRKMKTVLQSINA